MPSAENPRLSTRDIRLVATIRVGHGPSAVAIGEGVVWVSNELDGTVSRIELKRNVVDRTISVGSEPIDVAAGLGALWVVRRTP